MGYAPEGATAAVLLVAPLVSGALAFWPANRGHWLGPALAAPALLVGSAFAVALFRAGAGLGGLTAVTYTAAMLLLGVAPILIWDRRRAARRLRA